jgi:two-component system response regulator FlrC
LSADAAQLLLSYGWPGNIRELDNLLQRAIILSNSTLIEAGHIRFESLREVVVPRHVTAIGDPDKPLRGSLRATEHRILMDALRRGQSRREVAEQLGISPRTLRYKLAQLRSTGVEVPAA